MSNPKSVAVYARISSDQEGTALGVNRQLQDCRSKAEELGWVIGEEYVDNDISATYGKRRPSYERMLADLRDGYRDGVLVYHVDRLTRRPMELEQFVEVITAAGVRDVQFVAGAAVDIASGDGLLVLRMMGAVAANESASKSRRQRRKMDEVAASGRPHGGSNRPFGYEADRITVRADEADVIRVLVARFLAGESLGSLGRWLDDTGVQTVRGNTWRMTSVRQLLGSARIAGLREHRGVVVGPAVWDAIISEDDHRKVTGLMAQRASNRTRSPRTYLLSGMLRCGRCGGVLYSARRETSRRYGCKSGPDFGGCGKTVVTAPPVEELVADAVLYRLDTPELADMLAGRAARDEHSAALAEAYSAEQAQLEELAELYASKQITAREWMAARGPIESRAKDLQRRLSRSTGSEALRGYVGNGAALRGQWADLNLTRQSAIIKAVIDHIVITPPTVENHRFDPNRVQPVWRV
ncbi:MAG: recombinase family protein [Ilumatobacteraceae bacterium]